jgi:hypothetical protein
MRLLIFITTLFWGNVLSAQNLYNNVSLNIKGTASLFISNSFTNESSATYLNDATVTINGDITNKQASMSKGNGLTRITGIAKQTLFGTQPFVVNNILLNNTTAAANAFEFNNNSLTVGNSATFTDGIVVTNANKISFLDGTTYITVSDVSHVNGFVEKIGNQAFTFPVGDGSKLRPASISAPSVNTEVFIGKYLQTSANPLYDLSLKDAVLDVLSTCEYWTIDRTSGATNVDVTLSWFNTSPYDCLGAGVPPSDYYIGGWNGTIWKSFANGGTTGTTAAGTVVTISKPTVYGPFTLAKRNIPLPVQFILFDAAMGKEGVNVNWVTTNHFNSSYFIIERSIDGINWELVRTVPSEKESNKKHDYSIVDQDYKSGTNYYRLTEVSTKGEKSDYGVRLVDVSKISTFDWQIFPSPNNGQFAILIKDGQDMQAYEVVYLDVLGKEILKQKVYSGFNTINLDFLASGAYLVKIKLDKEYKNKTIIVN